MANKILDEMPPIGDIDPGSLVCSDCQVPAQFVEPDARLDMKQLLCPRCHRTMKFDVAVVRASEYVEQYLADQTQAVFERSFAGSKSIDFIPDQPTQPPAFVFPLNMGE